MAAGSIASITAPTMLQSGLLDATTPHETQTVPTWAGMDGADDIWLEMPKGAHLSFISICDDLEEDLLLVFRPEAYMDGCGEGFTPVAQAVPVLNAYLRAFASKHVLGQDEWDAILEGDVLDPEFRVETK